jgi:hypothetical protein
MRGKKMGGSIYLPRIFCLHRYYFSRGSEITIVALCRMRE